MALKSDPELGINSWLEDELYHQYLRDRSTVDESWKQVFEKSNGVTVKPAAPAPALELSAAGKIAENMSASIAVPWPLPSAPSPSR